jgi:hypothetical protein
MFARARAARGGVIKMLTKVKLALLEVVRDWVHVALEVDEELELFPESVAFNESSCRREEEVEDHIATCCTPGKFTAVVTLKAFISVVEEEEEVVEVEVHNEVTSLVFCEKESSWMLSKDKVGVVPSAEEGEEVRALMALDTEEDTEDRSCVPKEEPKRAERPLPGSTSCMVMATWAGEEGDGEMVAAAAALPPPRESTMFVEVEGVLLEERHGVPVFENDTVGVTETVALGVGVGNVVKVKVPWGRKEDEGEGMRRRVVGEGVTPGLPVTEGMEVPVKGEKERKELELGESRDDGESKSGVLET